MLIKIIMSMIMKQNDHEMYTKIIFIVKIK